MKQQINEIKRMQHLAGIIKESKRTPNLKSLNENTTPINYEKLKQILPGIFEIINEELSNEAQSYSSSSRRKYKSKSKQNDDDDYDDDDSRLENEESFNVSSNKYKKR